MRDFVLAIVGTIGIVALSMSIQNKKEVREDFLGNFPMRTKVEKVVLKNGIETSLEMDQYPLVNLKQKSGPSGPSGPSRPSRPSGPSGLSRENYRENYGCGSSRENYGSGSSHENYPGNCLGSRDVTNLPYVSNSTLNQNVNQPSPSLNLPSIIRYNAPSTSNMGITDNFQNKQTRENFAPMLNPNYTSSPMSKTEADKKFNFPESIEILEDNFEGRHGVRFKKSLIQRVSDKIF